MPTKTLSLYIYKEVQVMLRKSFLVSQIAEVIKHVREVRKDVIIFVDNCYTY